MRKAVHVLILLVALASLAIAQNAPIANSTPVQPTLGLYYTVPISATAAVGSPAVLTFPTPPAGQYIYVCSLALEASNDNTGTVLTNVVTTSANFNSFALKFSAIATASLGYDWGMTMGSPSTGCAKSTLPGTVTSFTSPTSTHEAYVWIASYFIAP